MKYNFIKLGIFAIFPIIFNILFFVIGGTVHPASVWISYAWIHVAFLIVVISSLCVRKTQSAAIFSFTASTVSLLYLPIEFIIGLIFIFVRTDNITVPIVIQLIPFCIFIGVFLWVLLHNEHTADNEKRRSAEISFIKTASSKAQLLMNRTNDASLKRAIEKLYDLLHSSPSKSYPNVKELESSVLIMLNELEYVLSQNQTDEAISLVRRIQFTVEERNRLVALSY